jgi:hypothetical protein
VLTADGSVFLDALTRPPDMNPFPSEANWLPVPMSIDSL